MGPLSGIRVLDLTRVLAGPFCTMNLGDAGAEVIKIEPIDKGDDTRAFGPPFVEGVSTYYLSVNRNKRSVAVDLKAAGGKALIEKLADASDVLVENFRPGVLEKLGLGPAALRARNPRLIYCSMSGYGHQGLPEYSALPGYDAVMQGVCGFQDLTGEREGPPTKPGFSIADLLTGMTGLQAILLALFARERTGKGQTLDIAMLDSTVQVLTFHASGHLNAGTKPTRIGNKHASIAPYETFRASDAYFNVAVGNDALWVALCGLLGRKELAKDPRFVTNPLRVQNRVALCAELEPIFAAKTADAWLAAMSAVGIPCGKINTVAEVLAHPQLKARRMIAEVQHPRAGKLRFVASPLGVEGVDVAGGALPPPEIGEHTREILRDVLKLPEAEIGALVASGAVAQAKG